MRDFVIWQDGGFLYSELRSQGHLWPTFGPIENLSQGIFWVLWGRIVVCMSMEKRNIDCK